MNASTLMKESKLFLKFFFFFLLGKEKFCKLIKSSVIIYWLSQAMVGAQTEGYNPPPRCSLSLLLHLWRQLIGERWYFGGANISGWAIANNHRKCWDLTSPAQNGPEPAPRRVCAAVMGLHGPPWIRSRAVTPRKYGVKLTENRKIIWRA